MPFWSQLNLQESTSLLMEPLDLFHDLSLLVLVFILLSLTSLSVLFLTPATPTTSLLDHNLLETIWTIWPSFLLIGLGIPSLSLLYSMDEHHSPSLTLSVVGHQWYWSYCLPELSSLSWDSYLLSSTTPQVIRLLEVDNRCFTPLGSPTRLLVTSSDVLHSWSLSSAALKVDATPGRINQLTLLLTKPGLILGQCSELCGVNHSFMPIVLESCSWSSLSSVIYREPQILPLSITILLISTSNLNLLLTLLSQVLVVFSVTLSTSPNSWGPWLLLIIFLGGVLISFSYVVMSTPDQPSSLNPRFLLLCTILFAQSLSPGMSVVCALPYFHHSTSEILSGILDCTAPLSLCYLISYLLLLLLCISTISSKSSGTSHLHP